MYQIEVYIDGDDEPLVRVCYTAHDCDWLVSKLRARWPGAHIEVQQAV